METREGAEAVRGEEFGFVEHVFEDALESLARGNREELATAAVAGAVFAVGDMAGKIAAVFLEPFDALFEAAEAIHDFVFEDGDGQERNQADHRAGAEMLMVAADVDGVVVEAIVIVPQAGAAEGVHGVDDGDEVLEEFGGDIFVAGSSLASSMAIESMSRQ